jgi:hypothetical protein
MVVIHLCVKLSVFVVSTATAGILKFPSLKTIYTHAILWQLLGVEKIQNGGHCHGNQGIKWPPNIKILRFGRNLDSK